MGQLPYEDIVEARKNIPSLSAGVNPETIFFRGKNGGTCNPLWPAAPYFLVSNMGEETIHSCDVNVYNNGELIYESQITEPVLPFAPIAEVQISPSLVSEDVVFELKVENINGDPSMSYSTFSEINFSNSSAIYISAQMDDNSQEDANRYEIINASGEVIHVGNLNANNALIERVHFMTEVGCHEFKLYDEGGNGVDGEIRVEDGDGKLIYLNNGSFEEDQSEFNVSAVSSTSNPLADNLVSIAPNPIDDLLQIELETRSTNELDICVVNVFGQLIAHKIVKNETKISFDSTNWSEGLYFVFVQDGNTKISKQVVKN